MILKYGSAGSSIEISDAPKITYSGEWLAWHLEFYDGVLYWEAWFLSSGTLTCEQAYVADAWCIGGGGQTDWSSGGGHLYAGTAGIPNSAMGVVLSDTIAVTIGAGGSNQSSPRKGGDTKLGSLLTGQGGAAPNSTSMVTDSYKRYRFGSDDKAGEAGNSVTAQDRSSKYYAQGGWTKIRRTVTTYYSGSYDYAVGAQGDGFGGGGGYYGWAAPGVLVIRIHV